MRCLFLCLLVVLGLELLHAQNRDPDRDRPFGDSAPLGAGLADMPAMPNSIRIDHDGTIELDQESGNIVFHGDIRVSGDNGVNLKANRAVIDNVEETALLTGQVSVRQKSTRDPQGKIVPGIQLFADRALMNGRQKTLTLTGNVSIYQGPTLHRGNKAIYNYGTKQLNTHGLASGLGPVLLESDQFRMIQEKGRRVFVGENAGITTHDVADPNYWIRADQTTIYPNDRITFRNMKLYAGDRAIFWLPYLSQPLHKDLGYHFIPGARSNWGFFLLNRYGIMLGGDRDEETGRRENAWLLSQWHVDLRTRRGVGTGLDLYDTRLDSNPNLGWLKLYYLNDQDPSLERSAEPRSNVNEDRWKIELKHRLDLHKQGDHHTFLEFDITALSDRFYLEDFEPSTFRVNPNPDNEVGIFHRHPQFLAGLYSRFRLNDFYQTDTRLPELFIDQIKSPLFGSPLLHEGSTSFGIYREEIADFEQRNLRAEASLLAPGDPRINDIDELLDDRGYTRFHTFHELTLPFNPGGKVNITPRVGFGYSRYSNLENTSNFDRRHLSAGVDLSMKFTRAYNDVMNQPWGIDGLLHTIKPYVNFSHLTTDEFDSSFRGIETLTPSTRPRPLEVGRFTATDDLMDWSIFRLGVSNTLMTRRDNRTHHWLVMNTYVDFFMKDPEFDRNISNLYNDLIWSPLPWMNLELETQLPIATNNTGFLELAGQIRLMPTDSLELTLGYRQLDNHPILDDSNQVTLRAYTRISEAWGIGFFHRWELEDGLLAVQQYSVHHDFDSWTAALGFLVRDNTERDTEYGVMLNFTLKEFPTIHLPLTIDNE